MLSAACRPASASRASCRQRRPGGAFAIRKQVIKEMGLDDYRKLGSFDKVATATEGRPFRRRPAAVRASRRRSNRGLHPPGCRQPLLDPACRAGRSGKTTFLNHSEGGCPPTSAFITIEDTREVNPIQNNSATGRLEGRSGRALVTVETLLQASMRLRPDRIFLGEIRGAEAYSFLRAINTGHPGSITTVHADSPAGAFEQLALMVMQAGLGLCGATNHSATSNRFCRSSSSRQRSADGGERRRCYFSRMAEWRKQRTGGKGRHGARRRL